MLFFSVDDSGKPINIMSVVVPIIIELEKGLLQTIGTGFYLTRYGLVITAAHVIKCISKIEDNKPYLCYVSHLYKKKQIILRKVLSASFMNNFDIGILQADNYSNKYPLDPLLNLVVRLNPIIPNEGDIVLTFAYPENEVMDFSKNPDNRVIKGDYYSGKFLKFVNNSENHNIPYPHFETSIKIKSGASGGPVYYNGKVIGINCRGWDFGNDIKEDDNLSSIIPISYLFDMKIKLIQLPEITREYKQMLEEQRSNELTIEQLINFGHILQ